MGGQKTRPMKVKVSRNLVLRPCCRKALGGMQKGLQTLRIVVGERPLKVKRRSHNGKREPRV